MERLNFLCPDHYPRKCNLSPADRDYLLTTEKYKAFIIFQYKNQDEWLLPAVEQYFNERTWRLFNAGKEAGTGTKFCNICRYALASDFGIVSLTPLNYNVFQEIGLMQGLQKPLIYLLNPKWIPDNKLPFDIDDQIYVEHTNREHLLEGLDKKISLVLEKVQLLTGFESGLRQHVKEKLDELSEPARGILKVLLFEGSRKYHLGPGRWDKTNELHLYLMHQKNINTAQSYVRELFSQEFLVYSYMSGGSRVLQFCGLNEIYRRHLEELIWEKERA